MQQLVEGGGRSRLVERRKKKVSSSAAAAAPSFSTKPRSLSRSAPLFLGEREKKTSVFFHNNHALKLSSASATPPAPRVPVRGTRSGGR